MALTRFYGSRSINAAKSSLVDFTGLPTSERLDMIVRLWDESPKSSSYVDAMSFFENQGFDVSKYTPEQFNQDWDDAYDYHLGEYDYVEDSEDGFEDEIETREDAYRWLQEKTREYGNTYFFPAEDKYKLDSLIERFGSTYFWNR